MKLTGFEVYNYASFDSQFVPISTGITVIAGLNNVGKTALLRALTIFTPGLQLPYLHPDNSSSFSLVYELEEADLVNINGNPSYPLLTTSDGSIVKADFTFNEPYFKGADILLADGTRLAWLRKSANQLNRTQYNADRAVLRNEIVIYAHDNTATLRELETLLPKSAGIRSAIYIPARRQGGGQNDASANVALPINGTNLASYLSTLQLNSPDEYDVLNSVFCSVFPYLRRVNAPIVDNKVEVRVTYRDNGQIVPLSACGTGVEQLLILLTCIMRSREDAILAIDEPHSFLHPSAERAFVRFLRRYPQKSVFLATHSAIIVNSVPANKITYINRGGTPILDRTPQQETSDIALILASLGYENSDFLFNNKLIFVEGPSEAGILPRLLAKAGVAEDKLAWVGMPQLEGANPIRNIEDLMKQVLRYEKLIASLSRNDLPRLYLFDGDRDSSAFSRMHLSANASAIFLGRTELENYMLDPNAIATAMIGEARTQDVEVQITPTEVQELVAQAEREGVTKGSAVLERVYRSRLLPYSKTHSGQLIADHLVSDWPELNELLGLLGPFINL